MEYAKFLREEEQSHREYLEKLYTITLVVLVALLGFLHFKTKRDVTEAVDAQFQATVEKKLRGRMEQFNRELEGATRKIEEQVGELEFQVKKLVEEVPARSETTSPEVVLSLSKDEEEIVKLMGEGKYSFRSLSGINRDAMQKGIGAERVAECFETLSQKGLIGKTLGKTGGDRWFVTEAGRKYLMSLQRI
ncbi:MAG: hypothetical protein ND895_19880 [Pyrinomonadaceae bacterium]|nr:hypothetical protein [Pyrinomonadaceae bacterium]